MSCLKVILTSSVVSLLKPKKVACYKNMTSYLYVSTSFSGVYFPAFGLDTEDTEYLSVFSWNEGKCVPKKLQIRTLFMQLTFLRVPNYFRTQSSFSFSNQQWKHQNNLYTIFKFNNFDEVPGDLYGSNKIKRSNWHQVNEDVSSSVAQSCPWSSQIADTKNNTNKKTN